MLFCNPTPIALACYLTRDVVEDILKSYVNAIIDLTELGRSLNISMGVCTLSVTDRNLKYHFKDDFVRSLNLTSFQKEMRTSDKETKEHWTEDYREKWGKSSLNKILKEPDH